MSKSIQSLYKTHILAHAKAPFNEGQPSMFTHKIRAYNPMCGDKFDLFLNIKNDVITDAGFTGSGCAISKASTSVLVKHTINKSLLQIHEIITLFEALIDENSTIAPESLTSNEELLAFAAARQFPERKTCANLAWEKLKDSLL